MWKNRGFNYFFCYKVDKMWKTSCLSVENKVNLKIEIMQYILLFSLKKLDGIVPIDNCQNTRMFVVGEGCCFAQYN